MAYKVNYGLQRAERNRAKLAKKEAKAREKLDGKRDDPNGDAPSDVPPTGTEDNVPDATADTPNKDGTPSAA